MRSKFPPIVRLAVLIIASGVWLPAQQTVWFTPLPAVTHPGGFYGSADYMSLFSPTALWQQAASHVQVFKIYPDGFGEFSDSDLTKLIEDLKRRHIALALETAVLTSSTCGGGIEGFGGGVLPIAQRIKALGGTLDYIAMQQPFQWGSLWPGTNACRWTAQQVAANALLEINRAKTVFPNLLVGDIMAVPAHPSVAADWAAQYGVWFDTWRNLSGAPLAFFHVDVNWTVPNWQAAVAAIRPVVEQRGIPFGMVYNGFLTDESDAAWMSAAENHMVDYEVHGAVAAPDQVNFQTWNPQPGNVLPETEPTAFTYLIDRYFRTRTQLTLANNGGQLRGTLQAGATAVAGASIQITAKPVSGSGAITTYTITGPVPAEARTALVGARINSECYSCNGPSDLTIYSFQYSENAPGTTTRSWGFPNGLSGWSYGPGSPFFDPGQGLHITAQTGQAVTLNSSTVTVTPGTQFTLTVTARVSPVSVGTGYFTLIWLNAGGAEPSRETILFQPQTVGIGTARTATDGSFSMGNSLDLNLYKVTADYAGSSTLWPAMAGLSGGLVSPPSITSLAPVAGMGSGATFSVVFSDPNGWSAIANAEVLINTGQSAPSGCYISYLPASGTFRLLNDTGGTWSSTVLSNSQCTLSGATASGVGKTLTLTLPLTFQASFESPVAQKKIFLQVTDSEGQVAPWQAMGVWYPTADVAGSCIALTVSPTSATVAGTGGTVALTLYGGNCGWTATLNASWLTSVAMSGAGTLSVTAAANTTVVPRSGTLTVGGQTVTVNQPASGASQGPPVLVSLNPFQGTGLSANLTLVYSDPNGWAAIQSAEFILNPRWESGARGGGCYIKYAPGTGLFTLIADDGNSVAGTAAPGSASVVFNSQCTLNATNSSVTGSGNTLTVVADLSFQPSFNGMRHIWMQAVDYNNATTNWLVYGAWFPTQTTVSTFGFYRIYDPNSKSYLNGDLNEYNYLGTQGFTQLGPAGLIMDSPGSVGGVSNIAWYRLYVNANASHFYTSDRNEFLYWNNQPQIMVGEGVSGFMVPYLKADGTYNLTPPTNMVAFYRAGQGTDLHYWTADADEFFGRNGKHMPSGYIGEGIASWVFPASGAVFNDAASIPESTPAPVDPDDGGPAVGGALNAASRAASGVIAPGQVLSVFGRYLGEAKLLLNGAPVEVLSSKDGEIRVVVPRDFVSGMEVSLEVEHRGRRSKPVKLGVVQANPAIFGSNAYGRGNAQARNEDGAMNGTEHAAMRGSVVTLYTTGMGSLDLPVEVHIGGYPAEVMSVRESATQGGVIEVQVRVPETVAAGAFQPVVLHVGNLFSQPGVGLAIQ